MKILKKILKFIEDSRTAKAQRMIAYYRKHGVVPYYV